MEVNRVIEIDADSSRESPLSFLTIRWAEKVEKQRARQPNANPDIEQDLCVLTHALMSLILEGEKREFKKGECISYVVNNLQMLYIDATMEITTEQIGKEKNNFYFRREFNGL